MCVVVRSCSRNVQINGLHAVCMYVVHDAQQHLDSAANTLLCGVDHVRPLDKRTETAAAKGRVLLACNASVQSREILDSRQSNVCFGVVACWMEPVTTSTSSVVFTETSISCTPCSFSLLHPKPYLVA